ncbi:mitogen-activated protein kinase 7 isoform X2 [Pleuronectes platessa]|uniref:mitogen-activated protein kinase 7 isoform X2 n=1 Tax=Pleuronectes platessa TaxID=8262 RepID=UPI00232A62CF|nr:mitogen-activated protein kinase 7 isoform X2 [Pleuronectes platessa]
MEETLQQEKQETEGGIRRRLRDRDLLRKRKAEAEEKETNQEERQRKRSRADEKSGTKRRGRPRKSEPMLEIPVSENEAASALEAPAVKAVVPVSVGVVSEQTPGSLTLTAGGDKPESQPESVPATPASTQVLEPVLTSLYAPLLTSPAPVYQSQALLSLSVPAPLVLLQAPDAVPVPALSQVPVPAPPQVETLCTEARDRGAFELIEDLGPDEEEDLSLLQDKTADEDLTEPPSIIIPEQDKMFSIPTLSSQPPPEYLPGNYSNL